MFMEPWNLVKSTIAAFGLKLILVIFIVLAGWLVGLIIQRIVVRFLKLARLDTISEKSGIANILLRGDIHLTLSEIIGAIIYWLWMLFIFVAAVNAVELQVAAEILNSIFLYIPRVVAALFLLVLGIFFASVMATSVRTACANSGIAQAKGLAKFTQILIIVFTIVQVMNQLQLDTSVFNLIIQAVVFALALGVGLAIGLGCKDIAAKYIQDLIQSFKSK